MLGDHANRHTRPREFGERTLKAGRMLHLCHENGTEDPWNTVAMAVCAFEGLHTYTQEDHVRIVSIESSRVGICGRAYEIRRISNSVGIEDLDAQGETAG